MRTSKFTPFRFFLLFFLPILLWAITTDFDQWGTFLLEGTRILFVQLVLALILYEWVVIIVDLLGAVLRRSLLSPIVRVIIFAVAMLAALPFAGKILDDYVDIYDKGQTLLVIIGVIVWQRKAFSHFGLHIKGFLKRLKPPSTPPSPASRIWNPPDTNNANYQNLLMKARGDKALVGRLVEYERNLAPWKSENELMEAAIVRWERDNR